MDIRLENFTKRFGPTTVIEGMDLSIKDGEMLALLGPSGVASRRPCLPFAASTASMAVVFSSVTRT
jgi:ABC-type lipopolysaccharide export system ATPase subunit